MDLLRHLRVTYGAAFAEQVAAALRVKRDEARKILAGGARAAIISRTSRKSGSARWRPTPREWKRWRSSAWNMTRMCVKIAHKRTTTPAAALKILLIPAIRGSGSSQTENNVEDWLRRISTKSC